MCPRRALLLPLHKDTTPRSATHRSGCGVTVHLAFNLIASCSLYISYVARRVSERSDSTFLRPQSPPATHPLGLAAPRSVVASVAPRPIAGKIRVPPLSIISPNLEKSRV